MGEEGEGSGVKGGGKWGLGTPPPVHPLFVQSIMFQTSLHFRVFGCFLKSMYEM